MVGGPKMPIFVHVEVGGGQKRAKLCPSRVVIKCPPKDYHDKIRRKLFRVL